METCLESISKTTNISKPNEPKSEQPSLVAQLEPKQKNMDHGHSICSTTIYVFKQYNETDNVHHIN